MRTIVVASDAPSVRADVVAVVGDPDTEIIEVDSGQAVAPAVDEHEPGHDGGQGLRAGLEEAAFDEEVVEARAFGHAVRVMIV